MLLWRGISQYIVHLWWLEIQLSFFLFLLTTSVLHLYLYHGMFTGKIPGNIAFALLPYSLCISKHHLFGCIHCEWIWQFTSDKGILHWTRRTPFSSLSYKTIEEGLSERVCHAIIKGWGCLFSVTVSHLKCRRCRESFCGPWMCRGRSGGSWSGKAEAWCSEETETPLQAFSPHYTQRCEYKGTGSADSVQSKNTQMYF